MNPRLLPLVVITSILTLARASGDDALYLDKNAPVEDRVSNLLGQMTLDEKLTLLSGENRCFLPPIPRLKIPSLRMADAAAGVRGIDDSNNGPATLFTCGVMMASTWDPELLTHVAAAIGEEAHNKKAGTQILLGPAVNIQRSPLGGRNGEYYTEDPYLAGRLAVGYIKGMQGVGTAACIKHFACNNEEIDRNKVNVLVGERALREIYLPAFEAGVEEGHVWCVMSSYNLVNGFHSSANHYLLTDVLKKGWGFDGMVMSDWGGVHAVAPTLNAGNDLEMPGPPRHLKPEAVKAALQSGELKQETIDDAVRRTLRTMVRTGLLDGPWKTDPTVVNSDAHKKIAREIAEQGIILLKNQDKILPLDSTKIHSIALLGPAAEDMQYGSRGSPEVTPFYTISPVSGITRQAGSAVKVNYVAEGRDETRHPIPTEAFAPASGSEPHGLTAEYFAGSNLEGTPAATRNDKTINFEWAEHAKMNVAGINQHHFSVRWTGTLTAPETGRYEITFGADDGCRLFIDNKPVIDHWVSDPEPQIADVDLVAGKAYPFRAEYFQSGGKSFAHLSWQLPRINHCAAEVAAAKNADVAIVFVSTEKSEGEGHDRPSMKLSNEQDVLVQQVVAANPHTIVVLNNGTPVEMPWVDQIPGLIEAWFPGQEAGNAIASILFGTVNPSGKLPTTLGAHREDYPDYGNFPGVNGVVNYKEGIYVGYRHFDKENITPLFPFGYGLSYTTFDYGALQVSSSTLDPSGKITVSLPIKNTGDREGREIIELYTHDPAPKIDKPVRELKGFAKVDLAPGETKTVTLQLTPRDLAYFDVPGKQWKADAGDYEIQVGASSRDIRQKATVHLSADFTQSVPLSSDQLTINGGFGKNTAVDQDDPTHF